MAHDTYFEAYPGGLPRDRFYGVNPEDKPSFTEAVREADQDRTLAYIESCIAGTVSEIAE